MYFKVSCHKIRKSSMVPESVKKNQEPSNKFPLVNILLINPSPNSLEPLTT